jgi:hypothetical protein
MMGRSPDFKLSALNKANDDRAGKLGAAWKNPDGSISIKLDPGTALIYNPDVIYTLFPADSPAPNKSSSGNTAGSEPMPAPKRKPRAHTIHDDDIPF